MKHSKAEVRGKARPALEVRFEAQNLTSYSGLILFQHFFSLIGIKQRLWGCFRHLKVSPIYSHHVIMLLLVVHLIIGHRRLRDVDYYRDDEMVKRLLGLKHLPDVSTISRSLRSADEVSVEKVRAESRNLVMERLSVEGLSRVTLDFDGSVLSTGRHAEGTAVGFNRKKKGARSYYPLFCTVAQTDQILDVHHRPGNVHDSNGADSFIGQCLHSVRSALPRIKIETRIDSAFFNETIAEQLHQAGAEFTISVPFERFIELKGMIEDGTAVGMGLATAVNRLKHSQARSKTVILLTDGWIREGEPYDEVGIPHVRLVRPGRLRCRDSGQRGLAVGDPQQSRHLALLVLSEHRHARQVEAAAGLGRGDAFGSLGFGEQLAGFLGRRAAQCPGGQFEGEGHRPAAHHGIEGQGQHAAETAQYHTHPAPVGRQPRFRRDRPYRLRRSGLAAAPDGEFRDDQRQRQQHHRAQVDQHEGPAAADAGGVGEAVDVGQAHGRADRGHQESETRGPSDIGLVAHGSVITSLWGAGCAVVGFGRWGILMNFGGGCKSRDSRVRAKSRALLYRRVNANDRFH